MTRLQVDPPARAIGFRRASASGKQSPAVPGHRTSWLALQLRDARKMLSVSYPERSVRKVTRIQTILVPDAVCRLSSPRRSRAREHG